MRESKGQVFIIGAVIFSGLLVIIFMTTGSLESQSDSSAVKEWFENSFSKAPEELNNALREEYSVDYARNQMYGYSRFAERSSTVRGIDFRANYLLVFPQKGEAVFINYRDSSQTVNLKIAGTWDNTSVGSKQYLEKRYTSGTTDFHVDLPDQGVSRKFTASNPRIFTWMKMVSERQVWINSELD